MSGFTKDIIARTLIELLDEKPMSKVTVKDIVERCGVNRNTFYYHFHDIPEVVEYVLKRKWDEILNSPRESNSILECMDGGYCKGKQKDDAECLPFSKERCISVLYE